MNRVMKTDLPRLAVFGDSHYACVKRAVDQGLVDVSAIDLEFWGHVGNRFRYLTFQNGAITPTDEFTEKRFAKFSTRNRPSLPISEFDWIFFMGCRIPAFGLFASLMQEKRTGSRMTSGLTRRVIEDKLRSAAPYGFAVQAADLGTARIAVAPTPFPTGIAPFHYAEQYPDVQDTTPEERAEIWAIIEAIMTEDGLTMITPPDEMFVSGLYCHPDFVVESHPETSDLAHKNAQYGARIFDQVLTLVKRQTLTQAL
jgi:hypothetical protein